VQANHGIRPWLTILGRPVGRLMPEGAFRSAEMGSIIVVIATDAPLSPLSLRHIARRAGLGWRGAARPAAIPRAISS
jgi:D-aminopeptidase